MIFSGTRYASLKPDIQRKGFTYGPGQPESSMRCIDGAYSIVVELFRAGLSVTAGASESQLHQVHWCCPKNVFSAVKPVGWTVEPG